MLNFRNIDRVIVKKEKDEDILSNDLSGRLKGIRKREKISQSSLARRSGVPQKAISRMENGLSKPSLETMCKLLNAMEYDINFEITKTTK